MRICLCGRTTGDGCFTSADRLEDVLRIESVGAQLSLADIYEKVEFSQAG